MEVPMRVVGLFAIVALIALASPVRADEAIPVTLDTTDHDVLKGTMVLKTITVKSKLGTLEIPAANVIDISTASQETHDGQAVLRVSLIEDEVVVGVIVSPEVLEMTTRYGPIKASWNDVFSLKVGKTAPLLEPIPAEVPQTR
jgi:hypothetical protein